MYPMMSEHSDVRASQRSLTEEEIDYILYFGKRHFCQGALLYYLRFKDLPVSDRRRDTFTHLVGSCVVLSADRRTVITVWRNRKNGMKLLRKKPEKAARRSPRPAWGSDHLTP
jgi:hypothetical protein